MTKNDPADKPSAAAAAPADRAGRSRSASSKLAMLFEISFEVCRQVGGIYTVLRSKVPEMVRQWRRRYCLIGPYDPQTSPLEFEPRPPSGSIGTAVETLRAEGFEAHLGRWLVTGQPRTLLLNPASAQAQLADYRARLWEHHGIPAGSDDALLDECFAFGYLVERFFRALVSQRNFDRSVLAHFHEWQAAAAVGEIRRAQLPVSVVFQTHATMLGRFLAHQDPWFYDHLPFVNWETDSRRLNIEPQVRLERTAAHAAHVFTTVSDITAEECKHLLGREVDLVLPNGLNIERFLVMHEFQNLHRQYKERIHQFVMAHFFPSYTFDLDKTLYFFTAGRYEYRNKGFDLTLEALARLNVALRAQHSDKTVVFFLITRRPYRHIHADVLHRRAMLEELRRNCDSVQEQFGQRLFEATAMGKTPDYNKLVDDYWKLRLRRLQHAWHGGRLPTIVTHELLDNDDDVLKQLRYLNLVNRPEDRVKVVYHPEFVSSADLLFGMDYDQFVRGCHLGIFPSFYEPWGYTPLECVARGVPTVTSDLSGFGTHLLTHPDEDRWDGILIAHRRNVSFEHCAQTLAEALGRFCNDDRKQRIALRNTVERYADQFDWEVLGAHYAEAHDLARQRCPRHGQA